jgi:hypothetical protein
MTITIDGTVGANKAVVLDSNGKLPVIDGSLVTTLNATQVTTGSIATARLDTGTTTGKVLVLDGSGNMPVVAAGAMTGVESATKSASNPTVSTNSALGTKWINTTTGDIFVCTTATTGANVWTNTGGTSGNVQPYVYQGSSYGYCVSGYHWPPGGWRNIDRYSFTSGGNAVDVGDVIVTGATGIYTGFWNAVGASSSTYGYVLGNYFPAQGDAIEKFQLVATADGVDIGDLTQACSEAVSCSTGSYAYVLGGMLPNDGAGITMIQSLAYASEAKADTTADLAGVSGYYTRATGGQNTTHGFKLGGAIGGPASGTTVIEIWQMATTNNSADHGDLTGNIREACGTSSLTHAYTAGGSTNVAATKIDRIEKVQMASSANSTDIANMLVSKVGWGSSSSTTHGYTHGHLSSSAGSTDINKFSHVSDANATDVGDLTTARSMATGAQY